MHTFSRKGLRRLADGPTGQRAGPAFTTEEIHLTENTADEEEDDDLSRTLLDATYSACSSARSESEIRKNFQGITEGENRGKNFLNDHDDDTESVCLSSLSALKVGLRRQNNLCEPGRLLDHEGISWYSLPPTVRISRLGQAIRVLN